MPLIKYITKRFNAARTKLIETANGIIEEYSGYGIRLTLRQIYYQMVARGILANSIQSYKRVVGALSEGRLAGLIDWDAIEDRHRNVADFTAWQSPEEILHNAAASFRLDIWAEQPLRVILLIEKDALASVFEQACGEYRVPMLPCKGYLSQSEMWAMAQRILSHLDAGQEVVLLHFGDHDPSGIDMTRDFRDRLELLTFGKRIHMKHLLHNDVALERLALNWGQVQQYTPPPNPAKESDARYKDYEAMYGDESWELDALEPRILRDLVLKRVKSLVDRKAWDRVLQQEDDQREDLDYIAAHFPIAAKAARKAHNRRRRRS